jgi:hypothetical protein
MWLRDGVMLDRLNSEFLEGVLEGHTALALRQMFQPHLVEHGFEGEVRYEIGFAARRGASDFILRIGCLCALQSSICSRCREVFTTPFTASQLLLRCQSDE